MLALGIISLVGSFILNIVLGVNAGFNNYSANYFAAILAIACLALGVVGLILSIRGIRDPFYRKKAIASTVICGIAITYAFAVSLIGFVSASTGSLELFDKFFAYGF